MFGNSKVLGIEIGRDDLKAVELKPSAKDQYFITGYGHMELTRSILNEGTVVDEDAFLAAFLQFYKENKFTAKHAVFGIDNQTTILRFATFPKVEAEKQRSLIKLNAQEHIPVPLAELELDYVELNETADEVGAKVEVLLCAVRKRSIQRILAISKAAGVSAIMITPSQIPYVNTVLARSEQDDFMAVRIGRKSVYHIVFESNKIAFMRNVNLDPASVSIMGTLFRGEKLLPAEIDAIASEISKGVNATINYYRLRNKREVSKIRFTGALTLRHYTASLLAQELQTEIDFLRLFEPDVKRGSSPPEDYDSCISLALSKTK